MPGPLDAGDSARQRHKSRSGKRLLDHFETEVVIGMVVGDVDRREMLTAGANRFDDTARVGAGERRIDQHRVARTRDQGRVHQESFGRGGDDFELQLGRCGGGATAEQGERCEGGDCGLHWQLRAQLGCRSVDPVVPFGN